MSKWLQWAVAFFLSCAGVWFFQDALRAGQCYEIPLSEGGSNHG